MQHEDLSPEAAQVIDDLFRDLDALAVKEMTVDQVIDVVRAVPFGPGTRWPRRPVSKLQLMTPEDLRAYVKGLRRLTLEQVIVPYMRGGPDGV